MATPVFQKSDRLSEGQYLRVDESLYDATGRYNVTLQRDGNLVIYDNENEKSLWASGTSGQANPNSLVVQSDSNTCLYDKAGKPYWATDTWKQSDGGLVLIMQDDGNLVLYGNPNNKVVWASNTKQ
ncbi:hypothetical protein BX600DRAFT_499738 [Xylariales sp. PMI_506]|nr:hypothetical protein BX600DRAFT_499738 [Xylariales sp. PMI_506]